MNLILSQQEKVRLGSNSVTMLSFSVPELQTEVGTISEEGATGFTITSGSDIFDISSLGVITLKTGSNYRPNLIFRASITSSKGKKYSITVTITDVLSTFTLNAETVLNLSTAI